MGVKPEVLNAALAGLLHDVGKFAQRAAVPGSRNWDAQAKEDFKYFHALLGRDFIERNIPVPWRASVIDAVGNHHRPDHRASRVVALADFLSAGERADLSEDERAAQPRQLLRIFCDLTVKEEARGKVTEIQPPSEAYWPLKTLRLDEKVIFPMQKLDDQGAWMCYESLWQDFTGDVHRLKDAFQGAQMESLPAYLENFLMLLQRYTWCMPSAYYQTRADISLYDHSRMTAALAAILADSPLSEGQLKTLIEKAEISQEQVALLVGGDLSGVQDFLYTISHRGGTSALRGRSFYLQLLTEAVARFLLHCLGLPITNLIYVGGGNLYLLARPSDESAIRKAQAQISRVLLKHHQGDLYLGVAPIPLQAKDFFQGRISEKWRHLSDELYRAKGRHFTELEASELRLLFQPHGHGGNRDQQCRVCGSEHPLTTPDKEAITAEDPEGVRKCPACISYEALGDSLRKATYLVYEISNPTASQVKPFEGSPGDWKDVLHSLGFKVTPCTDSRAPKARKKTGLSMILALKDDVLLNLAPEQNVVIGRRFLVNTTPILNQEERDYLVSQGIEDPLREGSIKPFQAMETQAKGIKRLGVLRMDVDNLGKLFSDGLGHRATLSRVASLSSAISLFFEGWVEVLAERRNQKGWGDKHRGDLLYSIYSGGDDLFFVGAWDETVELARQIRADLDRYTAGHAGIHASAGIVLISGKYPLAQAAQDAGRAEEQAKNLKWWDEQGLEHSKDAITFLGQSLPWSRFGLSDCDQQNTRNAHALVHLLISIDEVKTADKPKARQLARRLSAFYLRYQEALEKRRQEGSDLNRAGRPQILWGPWNWLSYYSLSRMYRQYQDEDIKELRDQLKADDFRSIEWIGLAARWTELRLRE